MVAPERLRFDFTHDQPLTAEEIAAIEKRANEIVLANFDVNTRETTHKRAIEEGVTALFGEKYGDVVRVVSFGEEEGISAELCGGTHVEMTAEIGNFRVINETSSAAGVRRIEVVTGREAEKLIEDRLDVLNQAATLLHAKPEEVSSAVQSLSAQNQQLQKELTQLRQKMAQQETKALLDNAVEVNGVRLLATQVDAPDIDTMRQMTDWFRDQLGSSVVVLGSVVNDKPMLIAAVTNDLIPRGMHAGNLVRDAAKIMGGGGGGRPNMAQAGGKERDKLPEALGSVAGWVEENLK